MAQNIATRAYPPNLVVGKTPTGDLIPVQVDDEGVVATSASLGDVSIDGVDGAITDGVDSDIKATVFDYTGSNPVAVILVDTDGAPYEATGGSGGGGAVTIADGDDVTLGAIADSAVTGDNTGTVSAKLRGLNKIFADVWDSVNHWLKVGVQGTVTTTSVGTVAHDAADSGAPVKVGFKARSAAPTAVSQNDRADAISDLWGRLYVRSGAQSPVASCFSKSHAPATDDTQATATQAAAGSGKRNVCTGFTVTLCGQADVFAATRILVSVIDGATGGTTYLWRSWISLPPFAGAITSINRSGLWLPGTQDTGLTIEFSAAGGENTYQSVSMDGVIIEE